MDKKRLLILGGSGFIGTNLTNYYNNSNYELYTTHYKSLPKIQAKYLKINLTKERDVKNLFLDIEPHIVIHAAAVTSGSKDIIERPWVHVTDNAIMNSLIFRECFLQNVEHCIFFSCTTMYSSNEFRIKEDNWNKNGEEIPPQYFGVAHTKLYSEKLCEFYSKLGNTKYTAIRHSNIIGPYDKFDLEKSHLVGAMINKVVNYKEIQILGDGNAKRDILYIDDLLDFINKCIEKQKDKFQILNCGYEKAFSIKEIIDFIQKANNSNKNISYDYSKKSISTTVTLDCSKAENLIGWKAQTNIKDGIQKTLEWYILNV